MPAKSYSARSGCKPRFRCAAKRVGETNCRIKSAAQPSCNGEHRFRFSKGDDFIDLGNRFPKRFKFRRSGNGEPGVRATILESTYRILAHDGVAKPIWRGNKEAIRKQLRAVGARRQVSPALLFPDQEMRPRSLPAIMHPEPISRRLAHMPHKT